MRSLQQLARSAVRRTIPVGDDFTKKVHVMPISAALKSYIVYEEELDVLRRERETEFRMRRTSRMRREHI